jgi:hypothetical protein
MGRGQYRATARNSKVRDLQAKRLLSNIGACVSHAGGDAVAPQQQSNLHLLNLPKVSHSRSQVRKRDVRTFRTGRPQTKVAAALSSPLPSLLSPRAALWPADDYIVLNLQALESFLRGFLVEKYRQCAGFPKMGDKVACRNYLTSFVCLGELIKLPSVPLGGSTRAGAIACSKALGYKRLR